ncbi:MFS transporter [Mesorhizobium sp. Z1-4]|uniref:MFS transporter n=1 Tax=Mesorhizobium sp. Z1-4 TaxID=2448478 RepID=UPI000FDAC26F|nr:MFS transporter [Mesorhizobium sp. Z1-4]
MTDAVNDAGWRQLLTGGNATKIAVVSLGVWLHAADGLMVATMIPAIVTDIGGAPLIGWIFALYEIGSIAAGASAAHLLRHVGLRQAMTAAALIYLIGCAISAMAPTMPVMLAGRVLQGLGGGGLVALSFIAVARLFHATLMPRVMAAVSALWGMSAFVGPLVGGVFAGAGVWRWAFWAFAIQAALLALWLWRTRVIELPPDEKEAIRTRFPAYRLALLAAGVTSIAAAGLAATLLLSLFLVGLGVACLGLFALRDSQAGEGRMLPPQVFNPLATLGAPLVMIMCFAISTIALGIYGPVIMVTVHGLTPLEAGYVIALESIGWSVAAILIAGIPERWDRTMILAGLLVITASVFGLVYALPNGPVSAIVALAILQGAGFGAAWTFVLRRATKLAPPSEHNRVASAIPTLHRLGYAIGAAAIGIVANAAGFADGIDVESARSVGFWAVVASLPFALLGLFAALNFVRERKEPARVAG